MGKNSNTYVPLKSEIIKFHQDKQRFCDLRALKHNAEMRHHVNNRVYYPLFGKPFLLAWAVLEIALRDVPVLHSYNKLIELCRLPGYQAIVSDIIYYFDSHPELQPNAVLSAMINSNLVTPVSPDDDMLERNETNHDFEQYSENLSDFVNEHFNHDKDRIKITAPESPNLCLAIVLRTWFNFNGFNTNELEKWKDTRAETLINSRYDTRDKRRLTQLFARLSWNYSSKQLILEHAERWYKCRVSPGTIEQYLFDESKTCHAHPNDSPQVSREIEEYDIALGYPR